MPAVDDARDASTRFLMSDYHIFPDCFTCGTARHHDGGLCIHPGPLKGSRTVATLWTPESSLPASEGALDAAIVWAALDCPGAFGCMGDTIRPLVLARMCAAIHEPVRVGDELVVLGWPVQSDGRKEHVGSAIYASDGRLLASAESLWIAIAEDHSDFAVAKSSRSP